MQEKTKEQEQKLEEKRIQAGAQKIHSNSYEYEKEEKK